MIPNVPGTYLLLFRLPRTTPVEVGRLGRLQLDAGTYGYVGSALGPGGLAARLNRHATSSARRHWHLDHVLPRARIVGVLVRAGRIRRECAWAAWARALAQAPVAGFGSSDCRCRSHLFHLGGSADLSGLAERARRDLAAEFVPRSEWT